MSATLDLAGSFLRPYQKAAIQSFLEGAKAGHRRQILQKPTGTGKTITGLALARHVGRTVWLAHREELIDQPLETVAVLWPDAKSGVVKQRRDDRMAKDIVFASVQTAVNRLDREWGDVKLLVVDEAHHAAATTYRKILDALTGRQPDLLVAGLTATPTRADKKNLAEAGFTAFAYRMSIYDAIRNGFLVPYKAERVVLPGLDLSKVRVGKDGDYDGESLAEELKKAHAAEHTAKAVAERCAGRKAIVFCVSVDQARRTAEEMTALGLRAAWVCGETPTEERRKTLLALKEGRLDACANAMVLTEGFDDPSLGAVVVARPTKSKGLYIQMVGRGLRTYPTKADCLILDLVGAHDALGLVMAPRLAEPPTKKDRESEAGGLPVLGEFDGALEDDDGEEEPENIEGEIVDRFLSAATSGTASKLASGRVAWIEVAPGLLALPSGAQTPIVMYEREGVWIAEVGTRKIMEAHDASLVADAAVGYAKAEGALGLSWKSASWRSRPPSDGQLRMMKSMGCFYAGEISQGEASDLITAAIVRRKYRDKIVAALL